MNAEHVDIVKNEWLAGRQVRVAEVVLEGEEVKVISAASQDWDEFVHRPLFDAAAGEYVYPTKDAPRFFAMLPSGVNNSYFFATAPHVAERCPFQAGDSVPLTAGFDNAAH